MCIRDRQKAIRDAEQSRSDVLNAAAGAVWRKLITHQEDLAEQQEKGLLDRYEAALAAGQTEEADRLFVEIHRLLEEEAGGQAGEAIRQARSYYTRVVQGVQGDLQVYRSALAEYAKGPELFVNRMWQNTRERIMRMPGVTKHFTSGVANEIRIKLGEDPEQRRLDAIERLREEGAQYDYQNAQHMQRVPDSEP